MTRARRRGTALFVITAILLVVAVGGAAAVFVVRRDTDELQSQTVPLRRQERASVAAERNAERRLSILHDRARATNQALTDFFAAHTAQVDASNHAVDVANQAVAGYNSAQAPNLTGAFQGAGDAALADLEARTQAVRPAADAAQRAVAALQDAAGA